MKHTKVHRFFVLFLVAAILCCASTATFSATPQGLTNKVLSTSQGGESIWSDPCTYDGAMVGAGIMTQNVIMTFFGLLRAIHVDNCF